MTDSPSFVAVTVYESSVLVTVIIVGVSSRTYPAGLIVSTR